MKPFLTCAAVAIVIIACPTQAQQFYHLESAVALKSAAPDWDYVTLDPNRGYLFIGRRGEGVIVYDAKTGSVLGKLPIESKKLDGTVPDGEGNLFMALRDRNAVAKINVITRTMTAEWKTMGCDEPTGIAFDRANKRIFVGCRGKSPV